MDRCGKSGSVIPTAASSAGASTAGALSARLITGQADALGGSTAQATGAATVEAVGTGDGTASMLVFATPINSGVGTSGGSSSTGAVGIAGTYGAGVASSTGCALAGAIGAFKTTAYTGDAVALLLPPQGVTLLSQSLPVYTRSTVYITTVQSDGSVLYITHTPQTVVALDKSVSCTI